MRPLLFDGFAVRPPHTFRKVEGVPSLARSTVAREVKFRDQVPKLEIVSVQGRVVFGETVKVVD